MRIQTAEVMHFIRDNREVFDAFERDLDAITSQNLAFNKAAKAAKEAEKDKEPNMKKAEGAKVRFYNPQYRFSSNEELHDYEFKGSTHSKTINEVFLDFLLNYYNSAKSGEDFRLYEGDVVKDRFERISLKSHEEKIAFVSSLFSLLYNYDFIRSVDGKSLEQFLYWYDLFSVEMNKNSAHALDVQTMDVCEGGESKGSYFDDVKSRKRGYHITISSLYSALARGRSYVQGHRDNDFGEKEFYKFFFDRRTYLEMFPSKTRKRLEAFFQPEEEGNIPGNISDPFAQKVFAKGLPKALTKKFYTQLKTAVSSNEDNVKGLVYKDIVPFKLQEILVARYGWKYLASLGHTKDEVKLALDIPFSMNTQYRSVFALDKDYYAAYISKWLGQENYWQKNMLSMLNAFAFIKRADGLFLEELLEETRGVLSLFLGVIRVREEEVPQLESLYTKEGISSGRFFERMKVELNRFLFWQQSREYCFLPREVQEMIEKDYFEYEILKNTRFATTNRKNLDETPETTDAFEPFLEEMGSVFGAEF